MYESDLTPSEPINQRGCFYYTMIIVCIISLLGSSIWGVLWAYQSWQNERAIANTNNDAIPTLAAQTAPPTAPNITQPATNNNNSLNRIVFVNAQGGLETINPDGTEPRTISIDGPRFLFPAWSPDGTHIAAIGSDLVGSAVYLLEDAIAQEESEPNLLYFSRDYSPIYLSWSPNSQHVSFIANHPDGIGLYLSNVQADKPEGELIQTGQPFYWQWLTDSSKMLIHAGTDTDEARLNIIGLDGNSAQEETIAPPGFFQSPDVSANGRYWAYAEATTTDGSWVVIADTQTGELIREPHLGQVAMSWNPAQEQLAFISGRTEESGFFGPLQLLDANTGDVTTLTDETVLMFSWSPNGRYLAYLTPSGSAQDEIQANGRRQQHKSLTQNRQQTFDLVLLDMQTKEGRVLSTFEPSLLFISQFIPFFDQYAHSHKLWSPNNDALVLPVRGEDGTEIHIFPITGGNPVPLAQGIIAFWSQQ